VDAAGDGSIQPERDRAPGHAPVRIEQLGVREFEPGREELDRCAVEQDRPLAVDEQVVRRHEPSVAGEESFLGTGIDAPVRLRHDEPVVPVDRQGRLADLDR